MATAAEQPVQPDREATRAYLSDYFRTEIHLVAILPDGTEKDVRGQYFGSDASRAEAWAYQENQKGWNVYTTVNVVTEGLNKKPKGSYDKANPADMGDMVGHRFVHVDWDPPKTKGAVWSVEDCCTQLAALKYPPSFILFTGGGVAPFWRLDETVVDRVAVETVNRALAQRFGGDHCHNHDRLMRLAGTVNRPDLKKRARGRTEALAYIIEPDDGVVYPLHALAAEYKVKGESSGSGAREAVDVGDVALLTVADLGLATIHPLRALIDQPKGEDRSSDAYRCAGCMVRYGFTDAQILGVLLNPVNPVSEHCLAQRGAERRAAERCIEGTRADLKQKAEGKSVEGRIAFTDFYAYMPMHNYIYVPTRETWPATSVNSRLPDVPVLDSDGNALLSENGKPVLLRAAQWLDENRHVEQMTWAPGEPMHIEDRLVSNGGWIRQQGASTFNLYQPPIVEAGNHNRAGRWLDHIHYVYPEESEHLIRWLAHRVQRPGEKINHAIVLGGNQGVGKDTMLEPVKYAVGPWNFAEVSPGNLLGRFNGFLKSVIMRVSEARDLGDVDRFAFYDHMKTYTAAPPDVLRIDEKNLREYNIFNVCGVIITTNHKADGIYLPADDRRHFVAWSERSREDFDLNYWTELYGWFGSGGNRDVAAYLAGLDLSAFDPKAPPPKTAAFWSIVDSNRAPEDAELADALEKMMHPEATTIANINEYASTAFSEYLMDRRNSRKIPHRLEDCNYVAARNPTALDGLWKIGGKRCVVYVKKGSSTRDAIAAAQRLVSGSTSYTSANAPRF